MSVEATRRKLTTFALKLQEVGLAVNANVHKVVSLGANRTRVTWASGSGTFSFFDVAEGSLDEYRQMLRDQQFSAVLNDGSLIQMSYEFLRDDIVGHRLGFLPSPLQFTADELDDIPIDDFIGISDRDELYQRVRTRPYLRFDFDADGPEQEPYSHVHTSFPGSRLPVCGPISTSQFIEFVFANFYPDIWKTEAWLSAEAIEFLPHCIRDEHRRRLHLSSTQVVISRAS